MVRVRLLVSGPRGSFEYWPVCLRALRAIDPKLDLQGVFQCVDHERVAWVSGFVLELVEGVLGRYRQAFREAGKPFKIDVNLVEEDWCGRWPRLFVFDVDGTLIQQEVIDELAKAVGKGEQVRTLTEAAMEGQLGFVDGLKKRVWLLKGLSVEQLIGVADDVSPQPGVIALLEILKSKNVAIACVSGGFHCVVDRVAQRLGIEYVAANCLLFHNDRCLGSVADPIMDAEGKREFVMGLTKGLDLDPSEVVVVGDGANDVLMLGLVGLSVGFRPKPIVEAHAGLTLNFSPMDILAYLFEWR